MKKANLPKIIKFAAVFVVGIFLLGVIFLNQIKSEIMHLIQIYGYIAIFLITLIVESLAQPVGPEIPLVSGKLLGLNMVYVALITTIASVSASFVNYHVGKVLHSNFESGEKYHKFIDWYKKHGKWGLLVAALGPVPYVPFCWFSGAFGITIKRFLYFGVFPRIVRIIFVSYIIYFVGI